MGIERRQRRNLPFSLVLALVGAGASCNSAQRNMMMSGQSSDLTESEQSTAHFETADVCADCHSNSESADAMRDSSGRNIGFYDLWQSSMMANAARDPLWRAVVSAESQTWPDSKQAIEVKCMRCHAPMADAQLEPIQDSVIALLDSTTERGQLGQDGVSCTVCHQIEADGLGTEATFSGGFQLNQTATIYGPHEDPFAMPMERRTGFAPTEAPHINEPGLCATCHTLRTHSLDSPDSPPLPEQTPYLEWLNSRFNTESGDSGQSCQSCHMPRVDVDGERIESMLARNPAGMDFPPLGARAPFARHIFVGGNTLIPAILRDNREALSVTAPAVAFDSTILLATQQLQEHTATLSLNAEWQSSQELHVTVTLNNKAGHKFPTGHPARRAWLKLVVKDADGHSVFTSGAYNERTELIGKNSTVLPAELPGGPVQPHYDRIQASDQVYVLESAMADLDGNPTYSLLAGTTYLKDNRLLPEGFELDHPQMASVAPIGTQNDPTFQAGSDAVTYALSELASSTSLSVSAELFYQPLSARYAAELFTHDTPEVRRFRAMLEDADRTPVRVAEAQLTVDAGP